MVRSTYKYGKHPPYCTCSTCCQSRLGEYKMNSFEDEVASYLSGKICSECGKVLTYTNIKELGTLLCESCWSKLERERLQLKAIKLGGDIKSVYLLPTLKSLEAYIIALEDPYLRSRDD